MKEKQKKFLEYGRKILPYLIFAALLTGVIANKENYFLDEIYSYGLANHVLEDGKTIRMQPKLAPYTYSEGGGTPYYEYMTVKPGERFHIANVWHNQSVDVHPPLYYLLLHIICSFSPEHFTKWQAGVINIFMALLTLAGVRRLTEELGCKERDKELVTLLFIASTATLGLATYFRMYFMAMCEITWFTWLILRWRGRECRRFYVLAALFSVIGALTHYGFVLYLFFVSLLYCVSLLAEKAYRAVFRYCGAMVCAGVASSLLFPAMWRHIFGGKGSGGESSSHLFLLKEILFRINEKWFAGTLFTVFFICLLYAGLYLGGGQEKKGILWKWILPGGAVIAYILLQPKIAASSQERYYTPVYAVMLVVVIMGVKKLAEHVFHNNPEIARFLSVVWIVFLLTGGWKKGVEGYLYKDSVPLLQTMESYGMWDALYVWNGGSAVMWNFMDLSKLRSVTFFQNNMDELEHMEELKRQPEYVLYVEQEHNGQKVETVMKDVMRYCPQITSWDLIGRYGGADIYHIYGE